MTTQFTNPVHQKLVGTAATIITPDGLLEIYASVHSGKIITRSKIETLTGVFHPGIIIGEDIYDRLWVAHNHYKNGKPMFETLDRYLDGEKLIWDTRPVNYSQREIVDRAIAETLKSKRYNRLNYNCQTFVNLVVRNEHRSESVEKLSNNAIGFGLALILFGIIFKSKALIVAGTATACLAKVGKVYSRRR
jgi:hypothetical protein